MFFQLMPLHWGQLQISERVVLIGKGSYRGVIDPGRPPCRNSMESFFIINVPPGTLNQTEYSNGENGNRDKLMKG